LLLVALCVAGFLLGQIQNGARGNGTTDPFTSTIRSLIQPVSRPLLAVSQRTGDWGSGIFGGAALADENRRLRAQLQGLAIYSEQIDALQREVDGLRKLQGFGVIPGKTRINATIVGYFTYENLVTLDAGLDKGVTVGCPVVAWQGLLGTVQSVDKTTCQVMLLNNPRLTIGAIDLSRKPPVAGLLKMLSVTFQDPQAPVEVGDMIVTSGFSNKIPRGLIIGKVVLIENNQELGTRRAIVDSAVSIGDVREVQILR
jgi:rod shape-determining protein MreC